jgi:hypothetical protein
MASPIDEVRPLRLGRLQAGRRSRLEAARNAGPRFNRSRPLGPAPLEWGAGQLVRLLTAGSSPDPLCRQTAPVWNNRSNFWNAIRTKLKTMLTAIATRATMD